MTLLKRLTIIFIVFVSVLNSFSQNLTSEVTKAIEGKQDGEKVDILIDFGKDYFKKSKFEKSANCYISAGNLYAKSSDRGGQAYCQRKAGMSYFKKGDYKNAIIILKKAKKNYTTVKDKKGIYNSAFSLADAYNRKKDYKNAIKTYNEALKVANNPKKATEVLYRIAITYSQWGNTKQAILYFEKTEKKAKAAGLTALANSANSSIEALKENQENKEKHVTQFEEEKQDEEDKYVVNLQDNLEITKQENLLSLKEIDKLSLENQAKQYRLHFVQEQYENQLLENEIKSKDIELLTAENDLKQAEIETKKIKIETQRKVLIIVGTSLALVLLLLVFIGVLYRQKKRNLIIVNKQKEEIATQHGELKLQKDVLNKQNLEITDSIKYAQKIQKSILPSNDKISSYINNFFIIFKPKDIVSGDFYWFYKKGDDIWGAIVDCTGHGVPGAFMSMIGNSLLNKIINEEEVTTPSSLLTRLNAELNFALKQNNNEDVSDDGMDMTVIKINEQKGEFTLSLANHNALIIENKKAKKLKGDIYSIGGLFSELPDIVFTDHSFKIAKNTSVYMFSDGYEDQFGGENNKKYSIERMEKKIISMQEKTLAEQKDILETDFKSWKEDSNQIDDVIIFGLQF